jgi:Lon protease-like protein
LLPIFPLPNLVLFPGVLQPLHIFEPRYRAMVADALEADRTLGMALLRPGWESDYEGRPPIYPVCCTGIIIHVVKLEDGRYNLVLRGLDRVRIASEDHERAYRRATVEVIPDAPLDDAGRAMLADARSKLMTLLGLSTREGPDADRAKRLTDMADEDFVHTLAQYLDLGAIEKQALLECPTLPQRAQALFDLLEMRRLDGMQPAATHLQH